jgi:hypothetical protein
VIPWRISFEQEAIFPSPPFFLEVFIDVCFVVDMFATFVTGLYDVKGRFITDKKVIAITYLKTWFVIDFLSTFPFDRTLPLFFPQSFESGGESVRMIKLIRIFRLVRLIKLLRVFRISSKFPNFDINEFMSPAFIRLIKLLARILFIAHLVACFWFLSNSCLPVGGTDLPPMDDLIWLECGSYTLMSQYVASFYWTIATMMAVGYGDISASTPSERGFAIFTQVVGSVAFGFIIATVTIIIETMDPEAAAKKFRRDELTDYLAERGYSKELTKKCKKHFDYYQVHTSSFKELGVVSELSHTLKEVILFESRSNILPKIRLFRHSVSDQFITECVLRLKPMMLFYHQLFGDRGDISEEVYFVTKGRVEGLEMLEVPEEEITESMRRDDGSAVLEPVICASISDGYELELANCLFEKPMNLRYRAAAVTDLLWLDHSSLVYLRCCFPRSIIALQKRAKKYNDMIEKVFASPVKSIQAPDTGRQGSLSTSVELQSSSEDNKTAGIKIHELVMKNMTVCGYKDVEAVIAKSLRGNINKTRKTGAEHEIKEELQIATIGSPGPTSGRKSSHPRERANNPMSLLTQKSMLNKVAASHEAKLMRTWIWDEDELEMRETEETEEDLWDRWLINPGSTLKLKWDLSIGLLIVISVIIVPFRLGFDVQSSRPWTIFDWITDFIFLVDIVVNFRTCYADDQQVLHTSPSFIANNYLRGWLSIDFLSTIPLDKLLESMMSSSAKNLRGLRLIRIIRLVRLAKLIKILTAQSMAAADDVITISPAVTKGVKLLATLCFIGHLFGCFFAYITIENVEQYGAGLNETAYDLVGWYEYEVPFNEYIPRNGASSWWVYMGEDQDDLGGRYLAALYWAFTTMTTVGYGDIVPSNDTERVYSIFIMVMGATVFGYIVGSVSGLASNPNGVGARELDRISTFQNYLEEQNIKPALRRLAKEQYAHNRKFVSVFDEARILNAFPIMLRKEMVLEANASTISKVSIFDKDASLIMNVMGYLRPAFFSAGQFIYRTSDEGVKAIMFLLDGIAEEVPDLDYEDQFKQGLDEEAPNPSIRKLQSFNEAMVGSAKKSDKKLGSAKSDGGAKSGLHRNIIEAGKCFGYQCFLNNVADQPTVAYRAFSSCSVMILREADLKNIIERHPVLSSKLQKALKAAIEKQTSNEDMLNSQVNKFQKKNSLFAALQVGLKKNAHAEMVKAIETGKTVEEVTRANTEGEGTGAFKAAQTPTKEDLLAKDPTAMQVEDIDHHDAHD